MIAHAVGVTPGLENWVGDRCEPSTGVQTGMWVAKRGGIRSVRRMMRRLTGRWRGCCAVLPGAQGASGRLGPVFLSSWGELLKRLVAPLLRGRPSRLRCCRNPRAQLAPLFRPMLTQMYVGGAMACTHDDAPLSKRISPMFPSAVHKCTQTYRFSWCQWDRLDRHTLCDTHCAM